MEEQASAAEGTPRSGLIDRWLATRTADDDAAAEGPTSASPHEEPPGAEHSAPARPRGEGPRSALSRLAERRAARGGQPRDFAAEILGALDDAPGAQSATSADVAAARTAAPVADLAVDPATGVDGPRDDAADVAPPVAPDAAAATSSVEPPAGRLSLAGLRARRKEAGFDPLDTRIAGLESLVSEPATLPPPDDAPPAGFATPVQEPIASAEDVAEEAAERNTGREAEPGDEQTPSSDPAAAAAMAPETPVAPSAADPAAPDAALAVAGSVPERDERAERLARMVRNRRGGEPPSSAVPAPTQPPPTALASETLTAETPAPKPAPKPDPAPQVAAPPAALGEPNFPPRPTAPVDPLATLTDAPQASAAATPTAPATFDAPEIPAGVDVFASLRDSVATAPKKPLDAPVDVLAPLRDAHGMPAPTTPEATAADSSQAPTGTAPAPDPSAGQAAPEAAATTPSLDPPRQGGAHAAGTDPSAGVATAPEAREPSPVETPKPVQAGKRRAKVDAPPPNPAADDAIMAIALEAVLRAEGGTALARTTASPASPVKPAARTAPEASATSSAATRPAKPAPAQETRTPEPRSPQQLDDGDLARKHRPPERPLAVGSGVPALVEFDPQRSTQHLLAMFLFLSVVATIGTGYLAYDSRGITEIAIAAFCGVLMLILWSAHSTAAPPRVKIEHGTLEVRSKDSHHRFDLTSPYTDLVATGTPGRRNWKVSIHRKSMRAFVIDSTMVDGREFMPVLEVCRAEARRRATDSERRHHGQ